MSYHVNAVLNPLPRLGRRSVGALGALGLGAVNATFGANIVAVARKFPAARDAEVLYLAVVGTPGLSATDKAAVTATILSQIVAIARKNPTMATATVVAQATAPKPKVVLGPAAATLDQQVAAMTKRSGAAASAFFRACMTDTIGPRDTNGCVVAAEKQLATLVGNQLDFYNQCMAAKPADTPLIMMHVPCYDNARTLGAGAGPLPPGSGGGYAPPADITLPADTTPAADGGLMSNKWVWVGGAVAVAGLAYVLLKKPAPAHA